MLQVIRSYIAPSKKQTLLTHRVLLVGAPEGGKTTLLNSLPRHADLSTPSAVPTTNTVFGVIAENLTIDGRPLSIWDIGIPRQMGIVRHHISQEEETKMGIVCVIDSTSVFQLEETKAWLFEIYEDYGNILRDAVLLVFANKQDRSDAMSVAEVRDRMELDTRALSQRWRIQGSSAITGEGILEGMAWMATQFGGTFVSVSYFFPSLKTISAPSHNEDGLRVIMLGLSGAGKTTILYRLLHNKAVLTDRTYGFNKETIQLSPLRKKFTIWDYSGSSGDIRFWHHLMDEENSPVIFVVDSTERDLDEVKHSLLVTYRSLYKVSTRYGILLVLCNKQDHPDAMSIEDIKDGLGLDELWQWGRRWHIRGVSAMTGDGLWEGLEWLETQLTGPALPSPFLRTH
ncbi:hypothetical protein BGZ95_006433 [Linnemannia exigua]|uniref:ADP-ribosylation factor n=1 Tax=Linnemannia exigua TaxID=604196 RepID=A0AAD4DMC4_9FUNG|nr:hypothetical protein BGZ95_006433 [Linnemannia exigua]